MPSGGEVLFGRDRVSSKRVMQTRFANSLARSVIRQIDEPKMEEFRETVPAMWEEISKSDYYYFTGTTNPNTAMYLEKTSGFFALFYNSVYNKHREMWGAQYDIIGAYRTIQNSNTIEGSRESSGRLLRDCFTITDRFSKIAHSNPSTSSSTLNLMKGPQKNAYKNIATSMKPLESNEILETLRRNVPRWMTHPIELDRKEYSREEKPLLETSLKDSKDIEMQILSRDEDLKKGKFPIHAVLKKAQEMEKNGHYDLGYKMRTQGFLELLNMERRNADVSNPELTIFRPIFISLVMGGVVQKTTEPYFNLPSHVKETMNFTFQRIQEELTNDKPSLGSAFLKKLSQEFESGFMQTIVPSIAIHAKETDSFNEITLIKLLTDAIPAFKEGFKEEADILYERRTYTTADIEEQAGLLTISEKSGESPKSIKELLKEGKSLHISKPLSKLGIFMEGGKANITIDVDPIPSIIEGNITLDNRRTVRRLPFQINTSADDETFLTDTVDENQISEDTSQKLKDIIALSIKSELQKTPIQVSKKQQSEKPNVVTQTQPTPRLTRQQRIEEYERRKKEEELTKKEGLQTKDSSPKFQEEKITGLTRSKIELFLNEGGITTMSTQDFIQRLAQALASSQSKKEPLGTKIETDEFGREFKNIDLRELILTVDKNSSVSVYLKGGTEGTLTLEGTFYKRTGAVTQARIQRVLSSILQNK